MVSIILKLLKVTNIYSEERNYLISTKIEDYKNNRSKFIEYLGGKIVTIKTVKLKYKSLHDEYYKIERFYCDRDAFKFQTIANRKGLFIWEITKIERRYINNILKKENINIVLEKKFLWFRKKISTKYN